MRAAWIPFRIQAGASFHLRSPPPGDSRRAFSCSLRCVGPETHWLRRGLPVPRIACDDAMEGGWPPPPKLGKNGPVSQTSGVGARTFRLTQRLQRRKNSPPIHHITPPSSVSPPGSSTIRIQHTCNSSSDFGSGGRASRSLGVTYGATPLLAQYFLCARLWIRRFPP